MNGSLFNELKRYKEKVKVLEERQNSKEFFTKREEHLDSQMRGIIVDRNEKLKDFEKQIIVQRQLFEVLSNMHSSLKNDFEILKKESSQNKIIFYDDAHKTALGYQNPLYLQKAQRKQPVLYSAKALFEKHDLISVCDSEEALILADESRLKMKDNQEENTDKPIDYAKLNKLYEYFVPQKQLSEEQVYLSPVSKPTPFVSVAKPTPTNVFPKKLPTTSMVKVNLQNAKDLMDKFNDCIKNKTSLSAVQVGNWGVMHIKGAFKEDVIPFFKNLRESFKLFELGLYKEVNEMKGIFKQMEDEVDQCFVEKK
ncbi:hypothetical protein Tco_0294655 [Tanacetum coccineum]